MQGKKVLVVCNLKAAKIVGFSSNGMVLAAKVCNNDMRQFTDQAFLVNG